VPHCAGAVHGAISPIREVNDWISVFSGLTMSGANKNKPSSQLRIPKAPWIYINDPTPDSVHASELAALIPDVIRLTVAEAAFAGKPKLPKAHKSVVLIIDSKSDYESSQKQESLKQFSESAIKLGTNFASIDIKRDMSKVSEIDAFGTNHLNVADVPGIATRIYKWLCQCRKTAHAQCAD